MEVAKWGSAASQTVAAPDNWPCEGVPLFWNESKSRDFWGALIDAYPASEAREAAPLRFAPLLSAFCVIIPNPHLVWGPLGAPMPRGWLSSPGATTGMFVTRPTCTSTPHGDHRQPLPCEPASSDGGEMIPPGRHLTRWDDAHAVER